MFHDTWRIAEYEGLTSFKRVRIRDEKRIQIVRQYLRDQHYVVLLGAPYSEKSWLLGDIAEAVRESGLAHTARVDLWQARSEDEEAFFTSLAHLISQTPPLAACSLPDSVPDGRSLQNFLANCLKALERPLVLLIDHLQALPHDLIHNLLLALRAVYTERQPDNLIQLGVVVTGGMNLAGFSSGPTSPFNIAKPVIIDPLDQGQSKALAQETLRRLGQQASEHALETIYQWVGGDQHLIPMLSTWCAEAVVGYRRPLVTRSVVERAAERLWQASEAQAPIREAIQIIEEDPDTLLDILDILDNDTLLKNKARQPITRSGANRLQLCGATILAGDRYCIKNRTYHLALKRHFQPVQVGHVLRMTGRWNEAIDYLAPRLANAPEASTRSSLLEAIVQSIYAADSLAAAYDGLLRGLDLGFGLTAVTIYQADSIGQRLNLVQSRDAAATAPSVIGLDDPDRVEAKTFLQRDFALRRSATDTRLVAALVPEQRPIGLVTVEHYGVTSSQRGLPAELPDLLRFLQHVAGAIENVMVRTTYGEIGRAVLDVSAIRSSFDRVLKAVARALGCDFATLYLVDASGRSIQMEAGVGRPWTAEWQSVARFDLDNPHPAASALRNEQTLQARGSQSHLEDPIIQRFGLHEHLRAFVPLLAGGRKLGVLEVGYNTDLKRFLSEDDRRSLAVFGDQVAIAVYNMQLLSQTDEALTRRVEEMRRLREVSLAVSSTLDLESVLVRVMQSVKTLLAAREATIWEYHADRQQSTVLQTTVDDPAYRQRVLSMASFTGQAIRSGWSVRIPDAQQVADDATSTWARKLDVYSVMAMPLRSRGQVLGALNVYKATALDFSNDEEELLEAFASQAATAIANARQYKTLQTDSFDRARSLLHRLGGAGDLLFQLRRARAGAEDVNIDETLTHIEQRMEVLMEMQRALRSVADLADMAREPLDLCEVVQEAINSATSCACTPPMLELPNRRLWVSADRVFLRDALQSVIENACEAISEDREVRIVVAESLGQLAEVRVIDDGPGVPFDDRERIFQLGFSTKAGSEQGRGWGLHTARSILHHHEGNVRLDASRSMGATFIITLPLMEHSSQEENA